MKLKELIADIAASIGVPEDSIKVKKVDYDFGNVSLVIGDLDELEPDEEDEEEGDDLDEGEDE